MKRLIPFILISLLICSCGRNESATVKNETVNDTVVTSVPQKEKYVNALYYDNLGKFMSGRDINEESVFYDNTQNQSYKIYKKNMNASWDNIRETRLNKMEEWFSEEISPQINDSVNLFYPFSGADVIHSFAFYPFAKNYFFIALENTGSIPAFENMPASSVNSYFSNLNQSIKEVMLISFFITNKMSKTMTKDKTDGVMPVLEMFISRTGCSILDIESGEYESVPYLKFVIKNEKLDYEQNLYYYKMDLSDGTASKKTAVFDFIKSKGEFNTYAKAASYLMHHDRFSVIRNFILDNANSVLEDDTAIPYSYFKSDDWDAVLYGTYTRPIKIFDSKYQADLTKAYSKQEKKPLPFKMGYNLRTATGLQFFVRK